MCLSMTPSTQRDLERLEREKQAKVLTLTEKDGQLKALNRTVLDLTVSHVNIHL